MGSRRVSLRKEIVGLLAILLLSGLFASSAYAMNGGDCAACHADPVGTYPAMMSDPGFYHHQAKDRINAMAMELNDISLWLSCESCHNNFTPSYGGPTDSHWCTDCHEATKHVPEHDQAQYAPAADGCQACHPKSMVSEHVDRTNLSKCLTCHDGGLPSGAASADGTTITAATSTTAINKGWNLEQPVNCTDCHGSDAGDHTAAHDPVPSDSSCVQCHVGAENVVTLHVTERSLTCNTCHSSTARAEVQAAIAAGIIDGTSVNCDSCHDPDVRHSAAHQKIIIPSDCTTTDCHGANGADIEPIHFSNTLTDYDCLTCHVNDSVKWIFDDIKSGDMTEVNCADCHGSGISGNHKADHDYAQAPSLVCGECHGKIDFSDLTEVLNVVTEHVDNRDLSCATCHDNQRTVAAEKQMVIDAIADGKNDIVVYCANCHVGTQHSAARHLTEPLATNCQSCHWADLYSEHLSRPFLTCGSCHNSIDTVVQDTIAKGKLGQAYGCADCHGAFAGDHLAAHDPEPTSTACAECHSGADNVVTLHVTNMGLSCSSCHSSADASVQTAIANGSSPNDGSLIDCGSCHDNAGQHLNAHLRTTKPVDCEDCHVGGPPSVHFVNPTFNCQTCHDSIDPVVQAAINSTGDVDCSACHGANAGDHATVHANTDVPAEGCAACHYRDIYVEHVTAIDPVTNVARNVPCASCHDGTYDDVISKPGVVVCSDCHIGSAAGHHAGTDAQTGNCTACHAVPDWAMDAPQQAACRQCHGEYKHGNGGPIQDYGACFACHAPVPYHAKPTVAPKWWETDFTSAPGRGTFNIFYSEYVLPEKSYKDWKDEPAPYGDYKNMREFAKKEIKDVQGAPWSSPAIDFVWAVIDHNGSTYNVPAFSGGGGGSEPPPAVENDVVDITRARWDKDRERIEVRAENDLLNEAQLTANYCNDRYPMSWNKNKDRWELRESPVNYCDSVTVTSSEGGSDTRRVEYKD